MDNKDYQNETVVDSKMKKVDFEPLTHGISYLVDVDNQSKHEISKTPFIIGRSGDCALSINNDEKVSRIHCVITKKADAFIIEDLGSTNGTFVNDKPIAKAILKNNTKVQIGNRTFVFVVEN